MKALVFENTRPSYGFFPLISKISLQVDFRFDFYFLTNQNRAHVFEDDVDARKFIVQAFELIVKSIHCIVDCMCTIRLWIIEVVFELLKSRLDFIVREVFLDLITLVMKFVVVVVIHALIIRCRILRFRSVRKRR